MHNHSGTTDFLKMVTIIGAVFWTVNWIAGIIGGSTTLIMLGAIVLVVVFAGGALFAHMNQKQTLDAITKFNANDAQIDKYRMASFKALAQGESAMQKAAAQLTVIDAKRVNTIATQQAKLLTDTERARWDAEHQAQTSDTWTWDDDTEAEASNGGAEFQSWR